MVYNWKSGSRFKADADLIGKEIEAMGERVSAGRVVQRAKNKKTELHKCFEWDDTVAAREYRLQTARKVLHSIVVVYSEKEDSTPIEVRAFESVQDTDSPHGHMVYIPTTLALSDPETREQVIGRLVDDIAATRETLEKYETIIGKPAGTAKKKLREAEEVLTR